MKKLWLIALISVLIYGCSGGNGKPKSNEIWYTTTTGKATQWIEQFSSGGMFATSNEIVSNKYVGGIGVILFKEPLQSIEGGFKGNPHVNTIILPDEVATIEDNAFEGCSSLSSIELPKNLTKIGNSTFKNCISLAGINIPSSVSSLGEYAFYGCKSLTTITIPSDVKYINTATFSHCTRLSNVNVSNTIEYIGEAAFENCSSLTYIDLPRETILWKCPFDGTGIKFKGDSWGGTWAECFYGESEE